MIPVILSEWTDLKPENILMTDETDEADPKILDFGLSKLINKGENCIESHGTVVIKL